MAYNNSNNTSATSVEARNTPVNNSNNTSATSVEARNTTVNNSETQQSSYIDNNSDVSGRDTSTTTYINTLQIELPSTVITKNFGRDEDYIELHVFNNANQLIFSEQNFQDFTIDSANMLIVDPELILTNRGYISGQYKLIFYLLKNKIFNSSEYPFSIKEVSTSRREIKTISPDVSNQLFDSSVTSFILEIESAAYFKEFSLNFGGGVIIPAINLLLNRDSLKYELILKTLDPLPTNLNKNNLFKIVEEITDPISIDIDLGGQEIIDNSIELMGPNFQIDTRQNSSIPSTFKTYNNILEYNVTSSYNQLLNKLENPDTLNVQYDYIRNVSSSMEELDRPYHFENFIHFSSAEERLKNFKKKIIKLEFQDSKKAETNLIQSSITSSNTILDIIENVETEKRNIIKDFDGYEHFLYFNKGSNLYTWPKSNNLPPYNLYSVSSSQVKTWLGDAPGITPEYSGQFLSASLYDRQNPHNLSKLIPEHILENSNNTLYVNFVNMIGQHFDHIWLYIKHLTEVNNLDNKFGISKELVYFQLKSLGIDTFDQFENSNLVEYILGEGIQDNTIGNLVIGQYTVGSNTNAFYNVERGIKTYVTASNDGSIPKGQITKEIWKRLYNNSPYLLKTKGTERGLRALMNCYGVPSTILNVKEYGGNTLASGPLKDLDTSGTYKTFSYDKSGLALKGTSGTGGHFIATKWSSSLTDALLTTAKTVEFRIKPTKIPLNPNQHLFTLSGSNPSIEPSLILRPYIGNDISASNDASQHGKIELIINDTVAASTSDFPIFNGDFWNIYIGVSGSNGAAADITFGAYQANWLKHVSYYTASVSQTEADRIKTFGKNNIGGVGVAYFGGIPANGESEYANITNLSFSGSIQEIKYHFGELLTPNTLKKHALEPFMYSGNTPSSSLETVVLRLPLGSNDQEHSGSFHPHIEINFLEYAGVNYSGIGNGFIINNYSRRVSSSLTSTSQEWGETTETHHLPTPDTVGASMTSEKVRIDTGTIPSDNLLLVDKKVERSTLDRQPPDYEDLGIFFSPTSEINEDIIYTLGSFRLDDYIGSPLPSAQSASVYEGLKDIQSIYNKKLRGRYNYWDYIKLIQDYDHTLFKIIEQFVPFKTNLKTGLLIEPTYLERTKFQREVPTTSDGETSFGRSLTMVPGSYQTIEAQLQTYNDNNRTFDFAPTNLYTPDLAFTDTPSTYILPNGDNQIKRIYHPLNPFLTSSNKLSIKGQFEPGTYVVSNNNWSKNPKKTKQYYSSFSNTTKTVNVKEEQGTNATIEIYEDHMNPFNYDKNSNNSQACQAPVRPFTTNVRGGYGIGFGVVGSSFSIGNWTQFGTNNTKGIGFSAIERTFIIENYKGGPGFVIGTSIPFPPIENGFIIEGYVKVPNRSATIGSSFTVGTFSNIPRRDFNYIPHKSNVLLGNIIGGKKSKKYFKYTTYTL
tara:strand:- start:3769 stop:8064 length:4296 start_codon:yes stop_codon:yes gene_type:complete